MARFTKIFDIKLKEFMIECKPMFLSSTNKSSFINKKLHDSPSISPLKDLSDTTVILTSNYA